MAIPSTGQIAFTDIQTEFGGTNPIGMNEYYAGGTRVSAGVSGNLGTIPSSGLITLNHFRGASAAFQVTSGSGIRFYPTDSNNIASSYIAQDHGTGKVYLVQFHRKSVIPSYGTISVSEIPSNLSNFDGSFVPSKSFYYGSSYYGTNTGKSFTIKSGKLYAIFSNGVLIADLETGAVITSVYYSYSTPGSTCAALDDGALVFAGYSANNLQCLNQDGSLRWACTYTLLGYTADIKRIWSTGNTIYMTIYLAPITSHYILAIDGATGNRIWYQHGGNVNVNGYGCSTQNGVAVDYNNDRFFVVVENTAYGRTAIQCYQTSTGALQWVSPLQGTASSLYISAGANGELYGYSSAGNSLTNGYLTKFDSSGSLTRVAATNIPGSTQNTTSVVSLATNNAVYVCISCLGGYAFSSAAVSSPTTYYQSLLFRVNNTIPNETIGLSSIVDGSITQSTATWSAQTINTTVAAGTPYTVTANNTNTPFTPDTGTGLPSVIAVGYV